ncbi:uncharacterized protein CTRU02_215387 [Colletotrichum truncatum]|uniref:Uncharacterized protein n=1 Tax=Colletotrichum truncatum TaxID=5467 RepID=A0ACC3YD27_COLTU|nr:uncharacterized protein CTRU02_13342 [Colletotrichum truncatum]KAF6783579.1 hypothetical protein CTRU02_13342 [Colletotrichum truncatum]
MLLLLSLLAVGFNLCIAAALAPLGVLTQVSGFGSNPAGLKMFIYVPQKTVSSPGIVVTLHGASGNAQQAYTSTPYASLAEQYGFIVIYPESPQGAWDATSSSSTMRDGGGASQSIATMTRYVINVYNADTTKIFASGISSGGSMANTLAGTYPDLFKGVNIYSSGSSIDIRSMYPGFGGSYPKVQLYLGSEDKVIGSAAFNRTLAMWAPVLGYDANPDKVLGNNPITGWTKYVLGSKLEGIWAEGVGHPVYIQGAEDMKWWGFA